MEFVSVEHLENREVEQALLTEMLRRERNISSGGKTADMAQIQALTAAVLGEDQQNIERVH